VYLLRVTTFFRRRLHLVSLMLGLAACTERPAPATGELTVFAAGSLVRPLTNALDSIAASGGPRVRLEIMGSREIVRAVTALGRVPDLIVTADADELERTLLPSHVAVVTTFAHNRVVLAVSPRTALRDSITPENWAAVAASGKLRIARTDPGRAPLGYRTQLVWKLAERELQRPGLAAALAAASPPSLMRGNEADLAALLTSGDADAAWCYESLARGLNLKYVTLGDHIDLGTLADSLFYLRAAVRVSGEQPSDSVIVAGTPIRYAIAVLTNGGDVVGSTVLRERLLDATSTRIMRRFGLDVLETPQETTLSTKLRIAP
jgi:molybdate/tungstate transport system substrate-binding protein